MATKPALIRDGRWESDAVYAACCTHDEFAWQLIHAKALAVASHRRWKLKPDDARDLAQQAVLRLLERLDTVRDPGAFEAFVRTVTQRLVLTFLTSAPFRREKTSLTAQIDGEDRPQREPSVDPSTSVLAAVDLARLEQTFNQLPSDCGPKIRTWLDWRELGGYRTEKEAAAVFDQSLGTFSARVSRCLELLRALVQEGDAA